MDIRGKKVLVIGSGISGINAASLLEAAGAQVSLFDSNDKLVIDEIKRKFMEESKVAIYVGELPESVKEGLFMAVLSPGVPVDNPLVLSLKEKGVK